MHSHYAQLSPCSLQVVKSYLYHFLMVVDCFFWKVRWMVVQLWTDIHCIALYCFWTTKKNRQHLSPAWTESLMLPWNAPQNIVWVWDGALLSNNPIPLIKLKDRLCAQVRVVRGCFCKLRSLHKQPNTVHIARQVRTSLKTHSNWKTLSGFEK